MADPEEPGAEGEGENEDVEAEAQVEFKPLIEVRRYAHPPSPLPGFLCEASRPTELAPALSALTPAPAPPGRPPRSSDTDPRLVMCLWRHNVVCTA